MQSLNKSKLIKDLETKYKSGIQFRNGWHVHLGGWGRMKRL